MKYFLVFVVLLSYPAGVPAPVPRCSPFIIINKLAEFNSIMSDSNPYFPVPPCEYGNPLNAILNKGIIHDLKSVFVTAEPWKIPLHNFYEFVWLLKTGIPRMLRIATGREKLIVDNNILNEGYQHYTPYIRSEQLGQGTARRPEIIDNIGKYKRVVGGKIGQLVREGPDRRPTAYTPQGPLRRALTARSDSPAAQQSRTSVQQHKQRRSSVQQPRQRRTSVREPFRRLVNRNGQA